MAATKIEWAERVWNPVTGCTPVSEGCKNCYAKRMAKRLQAMGSPKYQNNFLPCFYPTALAEITPRQKSALVFIGSMGDVFHHVFGQYPIERIITQMAICSRHRFMLLTKRASRMFHIMTRIEELAYGFEQWPLPNVALGVTCENQARLVERLEDLKNSPAAYRFLSLEPLLGPISLPDADQSWHKYIDLVIVGGESGPGSRPMNPAWARFVRDCCHARGVPFCFKQWGAWRAGESAEFGKFREDSSTGQYMVRVGKKKAGRLLDGKLCDGKINWKPELKFSHPLVRENGGR